MLPAQVHSRLTSRFLFFIIGGLALLGLLARVNTLLMKWATNINMLQANQTIASYYGQPGSASRPVDDSESVRAVDTRTQGLLFALAGQRNEASAALIGADCPGCDLLFLGDTLARLGRHEEALWWYEQAAAMPVVAATAAQRQGDAAAELGRLSAARRYYEKALALDPMLSHIGLVETLQALEEHEAIVELLHAALAQMPEHDERAWWQRQLGLALESLQLWPEALEVYQAATAESPANPLLRLGLSRAIYEVDADFEAAWDEVQEAIALDPEEAAGYFAAGELLVREERPAEADVWFALALELNPDNRQQLLTRANVARDADNLPLATDLYDQLLQDYPDNAGVYYEAAWGYRLADQPDRAIEAIERALQLDDRGLAFYHVRAGQIYEWTGDFERARQAYEAALALAPANGQAQRGLERLRDKE